MNSLMRRADRALNEGRRVEDREARTGQRSVSRMQRRYDRIMQALAVSGTVHTRELALALDVHEITVIRDYEVLAHRGLLERTLGGARVPGQLVRELPYSRRILQQWAAKQEIARVAAGFVQTGSAVFLDASSTVLALAQQLGRRPGQVTTSGLDAALVLGPQVPTTVIGGLFHAPSRSFLSAAAAADQSAPHPTTVFFSAAGFTATHGFTEVRVEEAQTKRALIRAATTVIALLDQTKFGRQANTKVVGVEDIDLLITDAAPCEGVRAQLDAAGVRLVMTCGDGAERAPSLRKKKVSMESSTQPELLGRRLEQ